MIKKLFPIAVLAIGLLTSCSDDEAVAVGNVGTHTYSMNFLVGIENYSGGSTRASYDFADGDRVHVLFGQNGSNVTGTAIYNSETRSWTLDAESSLADTEGATCRLAFFTNTASTAATELALTAQNCVYTADNATYELSDGLLTVRGRLTPVLGRIRFLGTEGDNATVSGLSVPASFNLRTHTLTLRAASVATTCGADGYTPYVYATFANTSERRLVFDLDEKTGLSRTFSNEVLQPAASGYIRIPTMNDHQGWTLIDLSTGQEIIYATLGTVTVSEITSTDASASCTVLTNGSAVSDAGFCWSTNALPTISDQKVSCGVRTSTFSASISGLSPNTTYYVRAYATTNSGTNYSDATSFTTRPDMVTRGLLAYYTFDDGSADNVMADKYHGFLNGGSYITDTPNGSGKALSLSKEQYVTISENVLNGYGSWTISLWLKDFGTGTLFTTIQSNRPGNFGVPTFAVNYDDILVLGRPNQSSNTEPFNLKMTTFMQSQWVHLTISGKEKNTVLYINGRRIDNITIQGTNQLTGLGTSMMIGGKGLRSSVTVVRYFWDWAAPMKVDNLRIHSVVLTDDEVKQVYDYER